jgi:hypothetical protein
MSTAQTKAAPTPREQFKLWLTDSDHLYVDPDYLRHDCVAIEKGD